MPKKRFKGRPIDPALLGWGVQLATVARIDYSDLQEDEEEGQLDEADELAIAFEDRLDSRQKKPDGGDKVARQQEENRQKEAQKQAELINKVTELEALALTTRMNAPAGLHGIEELAKDYRALEQLAQRTKGEPSYSKAAQHLREQIEAFEDRANALNKMLLSRTGNQEAVSWALGRDIEICRKALETANKALVANPPDTGAYSSALDVLEREYKVAMEEDNAASELAQLLAELRGVATGGKHLAAYALAVQDAQLALDTARDQRKAKLEYASLQERISRCKIAYAQARMAQLAVTLPWVKPQQNVSDALLSIGSKLSDGGLPFLREKKANHKKLDERATQYQRPVVIARQSINMLEVQADQLIEETTALGGSLNADKVPPRTVNNRKTKLPIIHASDAAKLASTAQGRILSEAIRQLLKESTWYTAAIEFIAGRLADGRGDHIHLAGGSHTIIYKGDILRGFMTVHLDSSKESQLQANRILYRSMGEDNVVDVAVDGGMLKEIVPDPV